MQCWQPTASIESLRQRAKILQQLRDFFSVRQILEVETPLLSHATVTDPHIHSLKVFSDSTPDIFYLQTSPEYAMKRLLAAGSGAIYQITKSFRQDEIGRIHNPEFSMLEWYRPGFDHHALMNEMDELLQFILGCEKADRLTYAELFQHYLGLDPHNTRVEELQQCADQQNLSVQEKPSDIDSWLMLLLSHCIEPKLGFERPLFLYDFPPKQAALAKIRHEHPVVASRFEVYAKGMELANGFHELQDTKEQEKRFKQDLLERENLGFATVPIDKNFLAGLEHGLPDCAGVALGIDRLVMLATNCETIADVISFDFTRA